MIHKFGYLALVLAIVIAIAALLISRRRAKDAVGA
jgi:hypothetical protein